MDGASGSGGEFFGLLLAIAVVVVIFLVFRAIILWYWKVNVSIELLQQINQKLGRLCEKEGIAPPGQQPTRADPYIGA
jgi:hypothetical protein